MKTNILIPIARETINHKVYPKQRTIDKLFTEKKKAICKGLGENYGANQRYDPFIKELLHSF